MFAITRPASNSRAADIVALYKDEPSHEAWRPPYERQVFDFIIALLKQTLLNASLEFEAKF